MYRNNLKQLFVVMFTLLCSVAVTAHDFEVDGVYYNINGSDVSVTYKGDGYNSYNEYSGSVVIPSTVSYNGNKYSVTRIERYAFYNCSSLTSIEIPNSVTIIGYNAFENCVGLTNITIGNSVTSIGSDAFKGCRNLAKVTLDCKKIQSWFSRLTSIKEVVIGNNVITIESGAFSNCDSLVSVTIGNNVTTIESGAFSNCRTLKSVTIPNSVTSIDGYAFYNCTALADIAIPNSVTSIDGYAFDNTAWYNNLSDGLVYAGNVLYRYKGAMPNGTTINVKEGISGIAGNAFRDCIWLTGITIPNGVTRIAGNAFDNCVGLTSVTIPNGVTSIDSCAFRGCTGLANITISNSVTSIGKMAFQDCVALTNITIPDGVQQIGEDVFWGCNSLTGIIVDEGNKVYDSRKNCNAIIETSTNNLVVGCRSTIIPNGVKSIGYHAFYDCAALADITIPNSVTSIAIGAFKGCKGIKSLTVPNSVTIIGHNAFENCVGLTNITIGNSVTSIGSDAFKGCRNLAKVTLNCKNIGEHWFYGIISINEFVIGDSVTKIDSGALHGTTWYNNQPNGVVYAGKVLYKYKGTMPDSTFIDVKEGTLGIADNAFYWSSKLAGITIPKSVVDIGSQAFESCTSLSEINCYATNPPTLGYDAFYNILLENVVLKVNPASIGLYTSAEGWEEFPTIIPLGADMQQLTVTLPADALDGKYENMYLELCDTSGKCVYRYIVTNKNTYSFNVKKKNKYSIYMKNDKNVVFGSINDVTIADSDVEVEFVSLLQPKQVEIKVLTPKSEDVTSDVKITWFDKNKQYISQGNCINNMIEGAELYYKIDLPESLVAMYEMPQTGSCKVKENENIIACTLDEYETVFVNGTVLDSRANTPILDAKITMSLHFTPEYSKLLTLHVDKEGRFSGNIAKVPFVMNVSAGDYISQSYDVTDVTSANIEKNFLLAAATGTIVAADFTFTPSVVAGDVATTKSYYTEYENVEYSIYNLTKQSEITNFKVQGSSIILLDETEVGDKLKFTVVSKSNSFNPIVVEGAIDVTNKLKIEIPVVELGKLFVTFATSNNNNNVAILYDTDGCLVQKSHFNGNELTLSNIADGCYSLITMGYSNFYNSISNMSHLDNVGLVEGKDFMRQTVDIVNGKITTANIVQIPQFDESKFYYTDEETSFTVNKPSITVGNYLTFRGEIGFKQKYVADVSEIKLIFDIPEGCVFVDNSVIVDNNEYDYTIENNRVVVDLEKANSVVRFCVVPQAQGVYTPNAFVRFTMNGREITQPIGLAKFEAESLNITVPQKTTLTKVVIGGVALPGSRIAIYDNGVLVGETTAYVNGHWSTVIELYMPFEKSLHSIYAEISTKDGNKYLSKTKQLEYDKNGYEATKVTMLHADQIVIFDLLQGKCNRNSYSWARPDYTFVAEFNKPDPNVIKNVEFVVLFSDGTQQRLPGAYNETKKAWVAKYENYKMPINVKVDFIITEESSIYDDEKRNYFESFFEGSLAEIDLAYNDCEMELLEQNDSVIYFSVTPNGYKHKEYFTFTVLDYESTLAANKDKPILYIKNESLDMGIVHESSEMTSNSVFWDNKNKVAYSVFNNGVNRFNIHNDKNRILPLILSAAYGVGASVFEYNLRNTTIEQWYNTIHLDRVKYAKYYEDLYKILYAKCDDGSLKISDAEQFEFYKNGIEKWYNDVYDFLEKLEDVIRLEQNGLRWECTAKAAASILLDLVGPGNIIGKAASGKVATVLKSQSKVYSKNFIDNVAGGTKALASGVTNILIENSANFIVDKILPPKLNITNWYCGEKSRLANSCVEIINGIKEDYQSCEDDEDEDEDDKNYINPNVTPIIDPAGYVYEGVPSNRLEGVTATCYYKETVEDMYGDKYENIVLWDAEKYGQQNPLITDKNGMYRWDVPQGLWQVKFEKEGYETAYSEWLPVPPPQLEVNIAMTQYRQPEVKDAVAYEDAIEIEFDKYMKVESLTIDNFIVTQNGQSIDGEIELLNVESSSDVNGERLATIVRFNATEPFAEEEIKLVVKKEVVSYTGLTMAEGFSQKLKVVKEVKQIIASGAVTVLYNGEKSIIVSAVPVDAAAGKSINASVESEAFVLLKEGTAVIDEQGKAQFMIKGELPGATTLHFSIEGTKAAAQTTVKIVEEGEFILETPQASVASGSHIYKGSEVALSTNDKELKIWYTTDGSCPCDENGTRKLYSQPIVISEETTLAAMAENAEGETSDTETFVYKILKSDAGVELQEGWNWLSLNMENDALSNVDAALKSGTWNSKDEIKNAYYFDSYSKNNMQWIGTLSQYGGLKNNEMYKLHSSREQNIRLAGDAVNPEKMAIAVGPGWNYISYLPLTDLSVEEALSGYKAQAGDIIKSQEAFAVYTDNNCWEGDLAILSVGKGYMLKRAAEVAATEFYYPAVAKRKNKPARLDRRGCYNYAENMNLIGIIDGYATNDGDSLVAIVQGEERGACALQNDAKVYLTIQGDYAANVELMLKRQDKIVAKANNKITFENNSVVGTIESPTKIKFAATGESERISVTPHIVEDELSVVVNDENMHKVEIIIYSTDGSIIREAKENTVTNGYYTETFTLSDISAGVYIVKIVVNNESNVIRIIKK